MGDRPVIKSAVAAAVSIAIGCSLFAAPAASQSISDRFKSLFGGKPDEPAQKAPFEAPGETDLTCPPVAVRAGASTFAVAPPGKQPLGNHLRYQPTITNTARQCPIDARQITAPIAIQRPAIPAPPRRPPTSH